MKKEFMMLVEARNRYLKEFASGAVSHLADDLGVSQEVIIQKATQLGIDLENDLTAEDIKTIYMTFDMEEKEAQEKARAEVDAIYGKKLGGQTQPEQGVDFTLTFADADEYANLEKELRKGYISSTPKLSNWMDIIGAKLQRIEAIGKHKEFYDASFKAYEDAIRRWKGEGYKTNYMGDYFKGGVHVSNGTMSVDMNMTKSKESIQEILLALKHMGGGALKMGKLAAKISGIDKPILNKIKYLEKKATPYKLAKNILNFTLRTISGQSKVTEKLIEQKKHELDTYEREIDTLKREMTITNNIKTKKSLNEKIKVTVASLIEAKKALKNLEKKFKEQQDDEDVK
jgi:hypothetical protein